MAKQALGKGLGALIKKQPGTNNAKESAVSDDQVQRVSLDKIVPSPLQPRSSFSEGHLDELKESIRQHGIIQPLITRLVNGKYELIAGERRWRASKALGLKEVPLITRTATDLEVLEMALIENLQREDLSPIEESKGYVRLAKEFKMKQDEIAKRVGKSRASVANAMRLLDLHDDIQTLVNGGQLSVGHAKAILSIKDQDSQLGISEQILKKGLTVRAAERMVQQFHAENSDDSKSSKKKSAKNNSDETPAAFLKAQSTLRKQLSAQVTIHHTQKKGRIEIEYFGKDDLQRILELLGVPADSLN